MVEFLKKHDSPFELSDFAEFYARVEAPASTTYRGYTVYKHAFSSQGPSLLQALNILEGFDLKAMGRDSADYVHTVTEAMKLAYADRDTYYADTAFVQVPAEGLLSKAYAKERAALIDPARASRAFIAGDPLKHDSKVKQWTFWKADVKDGTAATTAGRLVALADLDASRGLDSAGVSKDTTHIAIVDKDGNVFDSTPSGGWVNGAVILGDTGIGMSVRGEQFFLDVTRANQIRPRARPRYTLTPSMVFKDGMPLMALGTPGGDNQDQTILQAFLSTIEFWDAWYPNLHAALERPRVQTLHFLGSFWPHDGGFNKLNVEAAVPNDVFNALKARRTAYPTPLGDDGSDLLNDIAWEKPNPPLVSTMGAITVTQDSTAKETAMIAPSIRSRPRASAWWPCAADQISRPTPPTSGKARKPMSATDGNGTS
jgi:gamma-glutamyltranspeptidase/glutathione hydrolase